MSKLPKDAWITASGRVSAPHRVIRTFEHHCKDCGWTGPGRDLETLEVHEGGGIVDYGCPKCEEWIAFSF